VLGCYEIHSWEFVCILSIRNVNEVLTKLKKAMKSRTVCNNK